MPVFDEFEVKPAERVFDMQLVVVQFLDVYDKYFESSIDVTVHGHMSKLRRRLMVEQVSDAELMKILCIPEHSIIWEGFCRFIGDMYKQLYCGKVESVPAASPIVNRKWKFTDEWKCRCSIFRLYTTFVGNYPYFTNAWKLSNSLQDDDSLAMYSLYRLVYNQTRYIQQHDYYHIMWVNPVYNEFFVHLFHMLGKPIDLFEYAITIGYYFRPRIRLFSFALVENILRSGICYTDSLYFRLYGNVRKTGENRSIISVKFYNDSHTLLANVVNNRLEGLVFISGGNPSSKSNFFLNYENGRLTGRQYLRSARDCQVWYVESRVNPNNQDYMFEVISDEEPIDFSNVGHASPGDEVYKLCRTRASTNPQRSDCLRVIVKMRIHNKYKKIVDASGKVKWVRPDSTGKIIRPFEWRTFIGLKVPHMFNKLRTNMKLDVVDIYNISDITDKYTMAFSCIHNVGFKYHVDTTVDMHTDSTGLEFSGKFDDNTSIDCGAGIHFHTIPELCKQWM